MKDLQLPTPPTFTDMASRVTDTPSNYQELFDYNAQVWRLPDLAKTLNEIKQRSNGRIPYPLEVENDGVAELYFAESMLKENGAMWRRSISSFPDIR